MYDKPKSDFSSYISLVLKREIFTTRFKVTMETRYFGILLTDQLLIISLTRYLLEQEAWLEDCTTVEATLQLF